MGVLVVVIVSPFIFDHVMPKIFFRYRSIPIIQSRSLKPYKILSHLKMKFMLEISVMLLMLWRILYLLIIEIIRLHQKNF